MYLLIASREPQMQKQLTLILPIKCCQLFTPAAYEPRHEIFNNVVCVTSKASDQPALTRSLLRAFALSATG